MLMAWDMSRKVKSKTSMLCKKTKDADADRMLEYIWDNYNMLPFADYMSGMDSMC